MWSHSFFIRERTSSNQIRDSSLIISVVYLSGYTVYLFVFGRRTNQAYPTPGCRRNFSLAFSDITR
jgi:hypothetical protein